MANRNKTMTHFLIFLFLISLTYVFSSSLLALGGIGNNNVTINYTTSIKGNNLSFGDFYIKSNDSEILNLTISNLFADPINILYLFIPDGINVTSISAPTDWNISNNTNGNLIRNITFNNDTNASSIINGSIDFFSIAFKLNATAPVDGPINFSINLSDTSGINNITGNLTLTVDNTAPEINCTTYNVTGFAPATDILTSGAIIDITCASDSNIIASASLIDYSGFAIDPNWTKTMIEIAGNYSTTFDIVPNSTHDSLNQSLIVFFEDLAGNKKNKTIAFKNISIDTHAPKSNQAEVNSITFSDTYPGESQIKKSVNISIYAWDNETNITQVSANISRVDSNGSTIQIGIELFDNMTDNIWELNFTDTNWTGRYTAQISIIDMAGISKNTSLWFDIYNTTYFSGDIDYNITAEKLNTTITFYRTDTTDTVHENLTVSGSYNLTVGMRTYDMTYKTLFPQEMKTNNETHKIKIDSINTTKNETQKNILKLFNFDVNTTPIDYVNNTISVLGVWINDSVSSYENNISFTLNLSMYGGDYNINGAHIYLCNNWTNDTCDGADMINIDNLSINYTEKTMTYSTTIKNLFDTATIYPEGKNETFWLFAVEPKKIWFEIDALFLNTDANVTLNFYRPGTDYLITNTEIASNTSLNISIYNENYDIQTEVFHTYDNSSNIIEFYNVDMTQMTGNALNLTNLFELKYLNFCRDSNCSETTSLDNLKLPVDTIGRGYAGMSVNATNLIFDSANITLDYSKAKEVEGSIAESNLRVYKCAKYNPIDCEKTDWTSITTFEKTGNKVIIPTTTFSSYILTLYQAYNPPQEPDTSSSGGGGSSSLFSRNSCGDNVCTVGEDFVNCPNDCGLNVTCGNNVCDFFETNDNCPVDCAIWGVSPVSIETTMADVIFGLGSENTYDLIITNNQKKSINADIYVVGEIGKFIALDLKDILIENYSSELFHIEVAVPAYSMPGYYSGEIIIDDSDNKYKLPITMTVSNIGDLKLTLSIKGESDKITLKDIAVYDIYIYNMGLREEIDFTLNTSIKNTDTDEIIYSIREDYVLSDRTKIIKFEKNLDAINFSTGNYYIVSRLVVNKTGIEYVTTMPFEIVDPFWTAKRVLFMGYWFIIIFMSISVYSIYRYYMKKKLEKSRYLQPLDYSKLPQKSDSAFWLGNIAETKHKAWYDPSDLTTHALVAGSTGSGKSVTASVFVEEALKHKIPVVVFDPTAQWTGFVKACNDENLLKHYSEFGMRREDAKPFKGLIYDVESPDVDVDFKKYMNPSEITVFNLNKLKPGEYDQAVMKIIQKVFDMRWEESPDLKLLLVFDEVHRLLEKYGGKGGYVALEKACREFRKWGIGIIMASQVSADFKEAVQGNILTEIQLNTKSMEDISKIKSKYGAEFAKRITKQSVGVGMLQNPKYNNGKPWFVNFRPTYHNPHSVIEEELKQYKDFTDKLSAIEKKIEALEKKDIDTTDIRLEFRLAQDKLKTGHFRMAEIYLNTLNENLDK